jgi:hypothetical protein
MNLDLSFENANCIIIVLAIPCRVELNVSINCIIRIRFGEESESIHDRYFKALL